MLCVPDDMKKVCGQFDLIYHFLYTVFMCSQSPGTKPFCFKEAFLAVWLSFYAMVLFPGEAISASATAVKI